MSSWAGRGKFKDQPTGRRYFSNSEEMAAGTSAKLRSLKRGVQEEEEGGGKFEEEKYFEEESAKKQKKLAQSLMEIDNLNSLKAKNIKAKNVDEVFKDVISRPISTASIALTAMQDAMKPQKQTVLIQDENQLFENSLRTLLEELVVQAVTEEVPVMHLGRLTGPEDDGRGLVTRLLDIVLYLCERGHVEGGMVFQLLEDLTEVSTIKDCKEVFGYIEGKQETLGKPELFGRGKLVMLRTCNQLLRRLSKANDVVFCGRILMFLAHFFPLSERSAVNIKGIFNTSNETKYEKDPPADAGVLLDFNFYKIFWSLQEHFCNPAYLVQYPARWQAFSTSLATVLQTFEAQPLGDEDESSSHLDEEDDATFNIKYLTSSNLLSLELKDPGFRRHILVQCLIVFDYLKTPGKTEKEGPRESLREEVKTHEEHVRKLLEITPPKGKEFIAAIEHILERERNWVWWKRDGCPPFERVVHERKTVQDSKRRTRWRLGNKELSQLWKWAESNPNALTDISRVKVPSVLEYWKPLAEDMDPAAGIEPEYHHKKNRVYCWKGLRFAARQDLEGFSRVAEQGIEGVVPLELLPAEVRAKLHGKNLERAKQKGAKKEEEGVASVVSADDSQLNGRGAMVDTAQDMEDAQTIIPDSIPPPDAVNLSTNERPDEEETGKASETASKSKMKEEFSRSDIPASSLSNDTKSESRGTVRKRAHPDL
ncbi:THO complex subunit 1 [Marchantia polymorpha subsp. ruderalis]